MIPTTSMGNSSSYVQCAEDVYKRQELKLALAGKDGRSWFPGYFINDLEY